MRFSLAFELRLVRKKSLFGTGVEFFRALSKSGFRHLIVPRRDEEKSECRAAKAVPSFLIVSVGSR
jgi:hypothetical protein